MIETFLIEKLGLPLADKRHAAALRYSLSNEVSDRVRACVGKSIMEIYRCFNEIVKSEGLEESCTVNPGDSASEIRKKCKKAMRHGVHYYPMMWAYRATDNDSDADNSGEAGEMGVSEAKTSTERVRKYYKKHPAKVRKYLRDTVKDRSARNRDRKKAVKKHGKSKMKNHDVHHPNGPNGGSWKLAKKDHGPDKKKRSSNESVLMEGAAVNPHNNLTLTFDNFDQMLEMSLVGNLATTGSNLKKMNSQSIAFTVKDGVVRFARNKGHFRNEGESSLSIDELITKYFSREQLAEVLSLTAEDIVSAVSAIPTDKVSAIFGNGKKFMSADIIHSDTDNTIPYNKTILIFRGTTAYDSHGNSVTESSSDSIASGKLLADALTLTNSSKQNTFGSTGPRTIALSSKLSSDLAEAYSSISSEIGQLQRDYGLKGSNTISDFYKTWASAQLETIQSSNKFKFSRKEVDGLLSRWIDGNKDFGVTGLSEEKREWFKQFEKNELDAMQSSMRHPIEAIVLKAGIHAIKRIIDFISANNPHSVDGLKKEFKESVLAIRRAPVGEKIETLEMELARLDDMGINNITPSEGLILTDNGNPYKLMGTTAPLTQIMSIMNLNRGGKEKPKTLDSTLVDERIEEVAPKDTRPIVIFPGVFQPFHSGHYVSYLQLVKQFGKDRVYIIPSTKQDVAGKSPFSFEQQKKIMTKLFKIPEEYIVKSNNPYAPMEILKKLPEAAPIIFSVSDNALSKMNGVVKQYSADTELVGNREATYTIPVPENPKKKKQLSGPQIRYAFGNENTTDSAKQEFFNLLYGTFDSEIFDMITSVSTKSEKDRSIVAQHKIERMKKDAVKRPDETSIEKSEGMIAENTEVAEPDHYLFTRTFTDDELNSIVGKYFEDEVLYKSFPRLAENPEQLTDMIQTAPEKILDRNDLIALYNSDVPSIMKSAKPHEIIQGLAKKDKDQLLRISNAIKDEAELSFPVIIEFETGKAVYSGNEQLSVLAATGKTMPVKTITYDKTPNLEPMQTDTAPENDVNIEDPAMKQSNKAMLAKLMQMKITNPETGNMIKIDTAMDYNKGHPAHILALNFIRHQMKGLSSRAGVPKHYSQEHNG